METREKRGTKTQERREKVAELAQKSPAEIEAAVLPTVNDIYSHADFSRRRRGKLLDREHGQA